MGLSVKGWHNIEHLQNTKYYSMKGEVSLQQQQSICLGFHDSWVHSCVNA